jgi:hypothetical protein
MTEFITAVAAAILKYIEPHRDHIHEASQIFVDRRPQLVHHLALLLFDFAVAMHEYAPNRQSLPTAPNPRALLVIPLSARRVIIGARPSHSWTSRLVPSERQ